MHTHVQLHLPLKIQQLHYVSLKICSSVVIFSQPHENNLRQKNFKSGLIWTNIIWINYATSPYGFTEREAKFTTVSATGVPLSSDGCS